MSCCGQKRLAIVPAPVPGRTGRGGGTGPRPNAHQSGMRAAGDVLLRHRGPSAFQTRSVRTGGVYACAGAGATLSVDLRDAELLLRTGRFEP
jgi:hypothetical protein